jgi:hypothetical protein
MAEPAVLEMPGKATQHFNAAGVILGGEHSAGQLCLLLCPLRRGHYRHRMDRFWGLETSLVPKSEGQFQRPIIAEQSVLLRTGQEIGTWPACCPWQASRHQAVSALTYHHPSTTA